MAKSLKKHVFSNLLAIHCI